MLKKYDITSTEKLLERIRQDQSDQQSKSPAGVAEIIPLPAMGYLGKQSDMPNLAPRPAAKDTDAPIKLPKQPKGLFAQFNKKTVTVGIELKVDGIGLALIESSGKAIVHSAVHFSPFETDPFTDEETLLADLLKARWFPSFLQKQLQKFCGSARKPFLWCGLPRESVKVYNVTIPKVPDDEIANSVFWSLQKEEPFDREQSIIDFDLVKEVQEDSFTKLLTIVYLARRHEVENLKTIFHKIGFALTGISTPTVALQNEIRWGHFTCEEESFSRLVVGENKSFIEIYFRNMLVFSRDIKTGISSFIDSLMEMAASRGIVLSEDQCRKLILAEDREAAALAGGYGLFSDGETDIFSLDLPAPVRLIRQMERTFDFYENHFQIPRCSAVYLSKISFSDTRLAAFLSSEIGIPCYVHTPFASLAKPVNISQADSAGGGYRLAASFDMALSEPDVTRNFLLPRAVKEKQRQEARVNKISIISTAVLLVACAVVFFWQYGQVLEKQTRLQTSRAELKQGVFDDETQANALLMTKLGRLKEKNRMVKTLAERYLPAALLGQITISLPQEIKLLRFSLDDNKISTLKENEDNNIRSITLEGIVTGNRQNMEFILAKYIRKITQSSYIVSAIILEKATDIYMNKEVLSFTVQMKAAVEETKLNENKKA